MILFDVTTAWEQVLQESCPAIAKPDHSPRFRVPAFAAVVADRVLEAGRWLQRSGLRAVAQARPRRLRIRETVSLGDKRLVAIVAVDGVEYLIGSGTTNVCLLTTLPPTPVPNSSFQDVLVNAGQYSGTV